ncbi:DUF3800 domain-containing protein [Sphingorhabdus sp.]|jgi:hypothetical protein|uniref:DUF3800 domain-containing protein n=1 Tax=Sphingorhabdus sp. TaxID=1902408 RepID=UPI0035B39C67|nr:DUF3800 domain-containing protein [Sphingomonadaceae bacterium]
MPIYCDESGGVGRGVMTLAAIDIDEASAETLIARFRAVTGYHGEVKGSRIDLAERALLFELIKDSEARICIGIAISALVPDKNADRGDHDIDVYAALLEDVVGAMLPDTPGCDSVIIDDGRYGPDTLAAIRADIAQLVGPCGTTQLELSHRLAGLQIADVIANSFFNRALVTERQGRMAAIAAPLLESGQIRMRVLGGDNPTAEARPPEPRP